MPSRPTMQKFINEGKDRKAVAAQEMLTAQDSNKSQSKVFGLFTDEELTNIVNNSGTGLVGAQFVINYLHQAEKMLDKARMSQDNRNFIKGAISMLASFGNFETREHYEHVAARYYPEDLEGVTIDEFDGDFEDKDELLEEVSNEIQSILYDFNDDSNFFPEDWETAKDIINAYVKILKDNDIDVPGWIADDVNERNAKYVF